MTLEEKNKQVDPEEIITTGSASHGFGNEDFEEELALDEDDEDEDDDDDENTVEDG